MSFIQQITDESCFVRLIWDDGTEQDINKTDLKLFIRSGMVVVEDDSPFSAEIDYTKVTNPVSASALILHDAIRVFADTNPCDSPGGTFDPTIISGYDSTKYQVLVNDVGTVKWVQGA